MNYYTRGQTRKTIIDYHEEFKQAQTEWKLIIVNDSAWQLVVKRKRALNYHRLSSTIMTRLARA